MYAIGTVLLYNDCYNACTCKVAYYEGSSLTWLVQVGRCLDPRRSCLVDLSLHSVTGSPQLD